VEGWYGEPWGRPYYRIKDYVTIMRKVFRREEPVTHDGKEISLPFTGEGAMGVGKPLKSILHMNPNIPIWLGSGTETNVRLAGEVADGLLPLGFGPGSMEMFRPWLEEGFKRAGGGKSLEDFEIQAGTTVVITNDVRGALQVMKPNTARYVGGMGHKNINFHNDMMIRRGFPEAAARIQELYLAGRVQEAIDAVPDEYLDQGALIGPVERIKDRYREWEESGATGLTITADQEGMELMADLAGTR
jgi:F420-dependent oxidoreductase-like protein